MPQNPFQTIRFTTPFPLMPARSIPIHGNLHYTPDKELIFILGVIYNNSQTGPSLQVKFRNSQICGCPKSKECLLVFCITASSPLHCLYTLSHTLYKIRTYIFRYIIPFYLDAFPKLMYPFSFLWILCKLSFEMIP